MWKKIGSIGPLPNDNKSSRSKDQNTYQPFTQMSKIRMSQSQLFYQNNELFCPSYLTKKKGLQSKFNSQSKILNQQTKSHKQIPPQNQLNYQKKPIDQPKLIKKKTLDRDQVDQFKLKLQQKIINSMNDFQFKQQNPQDNQSTDIFGSQTSIQQGIVKLKQVKSTPQFNFPNLNGSIIEQISLNKKIQTQNQLKLLKKQHHQIKNTINNQFKDFKNSFKNIQSQIKNQFKYIISKNQSLIQSKNTHQTTNILNWTQISAQTNKFSNHFNQLNNKKAQAINKLISLRSK